MEVNKKKWLIKVALLSSAVVVLALVTFILPRSKVVTQQRAAFGNVAVRFDPAVISKTVNQEFPVNIKVEAGTYKVSAIDLTLDFDKTKLQIVRFTPSANLPISLAPGADPLGTTTGHARIVALTQSATLPTGTFVAGTLTLKGLVVTKVALTINTVSSMVAGENPNTGSLDASLTISSTTNGSYDFTTGGANPTPTTGVSVPTVTTNPVPTATNAPAPTVTTAPNPTPTVTTVPAPTATTAPPANRVILNFSVKFQGVARNAGVKQVLVRVKNGTFEESIPNVNVTADDTGLYSGRVTLATTAPGTGYAVFIKGPMHLAKKFCANNQTRRCVGNGLLAFVLGENTFDFSRVVLEAGDLPDPNNGNLQDGVANSVDYSLARNRWLSTASADLTIADVNYDGIVEITDSTLIRQTIETRYEDEE